MTCETCENCIHKRVCVYVEMAGSPEDLPDEESECVHFHPTERPTGEWNTRKERL